MTTEPRITAGSWLMVATLGLTWGGTFLVTELALEGLTPFWLAAGRIAFASVLMIVIWGAMGWRLFTTRPTGGDMMALAAIGAFSSAVPFMLLAWGQQFVTSGFAGVSMASVALIVLPLAHFLVPGERLTWRKAVGFAIGFAGVCVLLGGKAFEAAGTAMEPFGRAACIGAAACYGVSSILMRRLPAIDPIGLATVLLLIAALIVLPAAWIVEGPPPLPDMRTLIIIAFLGLIPTAAANFLRVLVIRSAGPVFMSLTNYQVPVWSVVLGALILSEPLPGSLLWALVMILAGVGLSQYGAFRRLFSR
ncbi:MAG: DMT family transporter [Pseudomonadota bacterium]